MCGLVGVVMKTNNGFNNSSLSIFEELLFIDTLRGPDSTGTFLVDKDGDVTVLKNDMTAWDFMSTKQFNESISKPAYKSGKALIGHNRKATQGKVNSANAHPFVVNKEFTLVHNGTLTTHKHLSDTEVDSEAIAKYLHDKWKDDDTPEDKAKVLAHIGGAWALIWYDVRTNNLNIVKNNQRPLFYAETWGEFVFSSEKGFLEAVLSRNNEKNYIIKEVPSYTVLTFNLEDFNSTSKVQEVVLPTHPFFPVTQITPIKANTSSEYTENGSEELSKNQFKKFLKNIIGKTIEFYVEDFVDTNTVEYYFYGQCYNYTFNHEIVGITDPDIVMAVIDNYNCAEGEVVSATFNPKTKLVSMTVNMHKVTPIEAKTTH